MGDLHCFSFSAPCRTIRLALAEKEVTFDIKEEKVWERQERFLALNPSGEVPVFVTAEVQACGFHAVMEFVEEAYPSVPLLGKSLKERAEVRRITSWFIKKMDAEVTRPIVIQKFIRRLLEKANPDSKMLRLALQNFQVHLQYLAWLLEKRQWLAGSRLTMADFAAASSLSILDYFGDVPWGEYDIVKQWYTRCKSRKAFRGILQDRIPGIPPVSHYQQLDF